MEGFMFWLFTVGLPGAWIKQFIFLIALMIYGNIACKEKRLMNEVYWKSLGTFTGLVVLRWLGMLL